jgi:hypothetical protein
MASVERIPVLGASQHHNTQESNRRRLQKKLTEKLHRQRTVQIRISRQLADVLSKLLPKKGGQKLGLTKGDMQILALMAEAGYVVDTETWTLVIARNTHDHNHYHCNDFTDFQAYHLHVQHRTSAYVGCPWNCYLHYVLGGTFCI